MAGLNDLVADGGMLAVPSLGSAIGGSTSRELMADARTALMGNWGGAVLGAVVYVVLMASVLVFVAVANYLVFASGVVEGQGFGITLAVSLLFLLLAAGPAVVGWFGFFQTLAEEGQADLERLFVGFRRCWKSVGVCFLGSLFTFLWSLLLVVPGIVASFNYAMAFYIIADEGCGAREAIRRSKAMMKGNRWRFFCLHWRFFGWALLANLTGGIGYLWLVPYMQTSFAKFYEDVK